MMVWSLQTNKCVKQFNQQNHLCPIYNICLLRVAPQFLIISDFEMTMWKIGCPSHLRVFRRKKKFCSSLALINRPTFLAAYQHSGKIKRWNFITGQLVEKIALFSSLSYNFLNKLYQLREGYIAVLCNNGSLKIFNPQSNKVVNNFRSQKQATELTNICQLRNGMVVIGNSKGEIILVKGKRC